MGLAVIFSGYGGPPKLVERTWVAFTAPPPALDQPGASLNLRLFSLSGNHRYEQWAVAWRAYENHRVLGSGAGTYEQHWLQQRPFLAKVRDAHRDSRAGLARASRREGAARRPSVRRERVSFFVDDEHITTVDQSPSYPMQLMLGIYEFPGDAGATTSVTEYPKEFAVDYVRGYWRPE